MEQKWEYKDQFFLVWKWTERLRKGKENKMVLVSQKKNLKKKMMVKNLKKKKKVKN